MIWYQQLTRQAQELPPAIAGLARAATGCRMQAAGNTQHCYHPYA